jgi:hypothetical protein
MRDALGQAARPHMYPSALTHLNLVAGRQNAHVLMVIIPLDVREATLSLFRSLTGRPPRFKGVLTKIQGARPSILVKAPLRISWGRARAPSTFQNRFSVASLTARRGYRLRSKSSPGLSRPSPLQGASVVINSILSQFNSI